MEIKYLQKRNIVREKIPVVYQITSKDGSKTLELTIDVKNGDVTYSCKQGGINTWPQELKEFYAKVLLIAAKTYVNDPIKKFNYFLLSRSIKNGVRSFAEVSRGLTMLLSEEEKFEVEMLKATAENYFQCEIDIAI